MKFTKELMKENSLEPEWNISDMFDAEIEVDEDDMKILNEYDDYCDKMKKETLSDMQVINLINNHFLPVKIDSRTKDTIYYKGNKYSNQQPVEHGYTFRHDFYAEVASFTRNNKEQSTTPSLVLFNNQFEKIKTFPGVQPKQLLLRNLKPFLK